MEARPEQAEPNQGSYRPEQTEPQSDCRQAIDFGSTIAQLIPVRTRQACIKVRLALKHVKLGTNNLIRRTASNASLGILWAWLGAKW